MAFTTRQSVLQRIRDGNEIGWEEFYSLYRPLIVMRGKDRDLRDGEMDDLIQEVMISVFQGERLLRYDNTRGRFRDYLRTIIDRRAIDIVRKKKNEQNQKSIESGADIESQDQKEMEERWEKAWYDHLLLQGLEELKEQVNEATYKAFHQVVVEHRTPAEVATSLGMSTDNVYLVKHRLLKKLRESLKTLANE